MALKELFEPHELCEAQAAFAAAALKMGLSKTTEHHARRLILARTIIAGYEQVLFLTQNSLHQPRFLQGSGRGSEAR
jgi:hypothetical protein